MAWRKEGIIWMWILGTYFWQVSNSSIYLKKNLVSFVGIADTVSSVFVWHLLAKDHKNHLDTHCIWRFTSKQHFLKQEIAVRAISAFRQYRNGLAGVFKNVFIWNVCCTSNLSWDKKTRNHLQSTQREVTKMDWNCKCELYPGVEYCSIKKILQGKKQWQMIRNLDQYYDRV